VIRVDLRFEFSVTSPFYVLLSSRSYHNTISIGYYILRGSYLSKLILATEVYSVVNVALEVLKKLEQGFHEKPYENALSLS
jgi:hypothetical protein